MTERTALLLQFNVTSHAAANQSEDVTAMLELSSLIVSFAAGSAMRSNLSGDDRARLAAIVGRLAEIKRFTRHTVHGSDVAQIVSQVLKFHALNAASQETTIGGMPFNLPAIESQFFREQNVKLAGEIVEAIDRYASGRHIEEADARLEKARTVPILKTAIELFESGYLCSLQRGSRDIDRGICEGAERAISCAIVAGVAENVISEHFFSSDDLCETMKRQSRERFKVDPQSGPFGVA